STAAFSYLPLWDSFNDFLPDLLQDGRYAPGCNNNPSTSTPYAWPTYGVWAARVGKQYNLGCNRKATYADGTMLKADLDIFDGSLFPITQTDFSSYPIVNPSTNAWAMTLPSSLTHIGQTTMSVQNFDRAYLGWNCSTTSITNSYNSALPPCSNFQTLNVVATATLPNGAPLYIFDSNAD